AGICDRGLRGSNLARNQMSLHRVSVDAVVELRQRAIEIPCERQAAIFVFLEPLEFLDEVDLELGTDPHPEFKCDVTVSECAAISSRARRKPNRSSLLDPLFDTELVAIQA